MIEYIANSVEETFIAAKETAKKLKKNDIILFRGEMGAGKTAFTKGIADYFGVKDAVTSPTFALVHEYYGGSLPIFHFDLYRISGFDDLYSIGFYDYLDRGGIIIAEWSENIDGLSDEFPEAVIIEITKLSDNGRRITISGGLDDTWN